MYRENYKYYCKSLESLNIYPRFELKNGVTPGVFLFKIDNIDNLQSLKEFFWENGVLCSVFYGEKAFYLPCHHNICKMDIDYFKELLIHYNKRKSHV